ncbi:hypothetical protein Ddye_027169 [Dipteronia dyeriana]|uniref:Uncharacterized protein n=1 Tax=Dipteronia dyeriana TaxID=168575 RepID=A0AAD9WPX7_9ROSI|nr:hypothetical protein Ddye_027169 [Dipteronia dyeriana]
MDLLCNADPKHHPDPVPALSCLKLQFRDLFPKAAPVADRHISKRKRAAELSVSGDPTVPDPSPSKEHPDPPPVVVTTPSATAALVPSHMGPLVGDRRESGLSPSIAAYCCRVAEVIAPVQDNLIGGTLSDLLSSESSSSTGVVEVIVPEEDKLMKGSVSDLLTAFEEMNIKASYLSHRLSDAFPKVINERNGLKEKFSAACSKIQLLESKLKSTQHDLSIYQGKSYMATHKWHLLENRLEKTLNEAKADKAKLEAKVIKLEKLVARTNESIGTMYIEGYMAAQLEVRRRYPNDNLGWMKFPLREDLACDDKEDSEGDSNDDEASVE